jgi:hypothetical protein
MSVNRDHSAAPGKGKAPGKAKASARRTVTASAEQSVAQNVAPSPHVPPGGQKWLHLFTGTSRQLFVQDVLNLLASPNGLHYRFRYSTDLLPVDVCDPWAANELGQRSVIVYHVISQEYQYHNAAYLPLRIGTVVETSTLGRTHSIVFELGRYCSLSVKADGESVMGPAVQKFSDHIRTEFAGSNPDVQKYVVLGNEPPTALVDYSSDPEQIWETSVSYFRHTLAFRDAVFWRIDTIQRHQSGAARLPVPLAKGALTLDANNAYSLQLIQFQARDMTEAAATKVSVTAPTDVLQLIGPDTVLISTEYDAPAFQLFAVQRENPVDAVMSVQSEAPAFGAVVPIQLHIATDKVTTVGTGLFTIAGLFLTALPALMSADTSFSQKALTAAAGALITTGAVFWRRLKGLAGLS